MGRFSDNDAGRIGVNNDINNNESDARLSAEGRDGRAFGTDTSDERDGSAALGARGTRAKEKNTDNDGEGARGTDDNGAARGFTLPGLIFLALSLLALGFGVYLACVCFSSAHLTSGALAAVLSMVSGGAEMLGDAVVKLVSGVISSIAFGAATVVLGRISRLLAARVRESEEGVLSLLAKITSIAALVLSLAVFVVAALIIIPWG